MTDAQRLVEAVMRERGYPVERYDQTIADLSVEHAQTLEHFRAAHDISQRADSGQASTEDLRLAMLHYRELFSELLGGSATGAAYPDSAPDRAQVVGQGTPADSSVGAGADVPDQPLQ